MKEDLLTTATKVPGPIISDEFHFKINHRIHNQDQFEAFLKYSPGAIAMFDRDLTYLFANEGWLQDYGIQDRDVIGKSYYDVLPQLKIQPKWLSDHARVLTGETMKSDLDSFAQNGETVYFKWQMAPWRKSDGTIAGIIISTEIIPEIRRKVRKLEKLVEEKTFELRNANQELESFSYSISHDLRAPLRAINGFAAALHEDYSDQLDERAITFLDRILSNSEKMERLIDDLLKFSRMNRKQSNFCEVDLKPMIIKIINDIFPLSCPIIKIDKLPIIVGDLEMLEQVFTNLLSNAIKYTSKEAQPAIEIAADERDDHHIVMITDNGVGFDVQESEKLFNVFERLHGVEEFEGTGVGLAICQKIIHAHQGDIWAESIPGKGSTFFLKFKKSISC